MPAQANATVTRVTTATAATGGRDNYDAPEGAEPAGAGADKWTGRARAYYRETVDRMAAGDAVNVSARRTVILDTADYDELGADTDDVITVELDAGPVITGRAQAIARRALRGIPRELATTRLDLDPV